MSKSEVHQKRGKYSRSKGKRYEQEVARKLRSLFGSKIRRGWQSREGSDEADVVGLPPLWIECKDRKNLSILAAIRQACQAADTAETSATPVVFAKYSNRKVFANHRLEIVAFPVGIGTDCSEAKSMMCLCDDSVRTPSSTWLATVRTLAPTMHRLATVSWPEVSPVVPFEVMGVGDKWDGLWQASPVSLVYDSLAIVADRILADTSRSLGSDVWEVYETLLALANEPASLYQQVCRRRESMMLYLGEDDE